MVMRAVMDEFVEQMKPLQEKYHLERESQFNWYEYPECADLSFYDTYTTYPGINYVVKDATLIWGYQMWLRIEIDHNLFARFIIHREQRELQMTCRILRLLMMQQLRWRIRKNG